MKQLLRENAINKRTCYLDNPHKIGDIVKPIDTDAAITGCIDYPVFISQKQTQINNLGTKDRPGPD